MFSSKKIPFTPWSIVLTSLNHEFYFNVETMKSTWEIPDELADIIGHLVAMSLGIEIEEPSSHQESEAVKRKPESDDTNAAKRSKTFEQTFKQEDYKQPTINTAVPTAIEQHSSVERDETTGKESELSLPVSSSKDKTNLDIENNDKLNEIPLEEQREQFIVCFSPKLLI